MYSEYLVHLQIIYYKKLLMTTDEIRFFDSLSKSWDDNEVLSTPQKIKEILSLTGIKRGMNILDLGTGTGVLLPFLSSIVDRDGHIKAVDISQGMLSRAKEKFGHLRNLSFMKLDFEEESINGKYDMIFLYCVYPHLKSPRETLTRLISNNLKEDGRIVIAFPTDEMFINNIHKEKKAAGDLLPSAPKLSSRLKEWGLCSSVLRYDPGHYIIEIKN